MFIIVLTSAVCWGTCISVTQYNKTQVQYKPWYKLTDCNKNKNYIQNVDERSGFLHHHDQRFIVCVDFNCPGVDGRQLKTPTWRICCIVTTWRSTSSKPHAATTSSTCCWHLPVTTTCCLRSPSGQHASATTTSLPVVCMCRSTCRPSRATATATWRRSTAISTSRLCTTSTALHQSTATSNWSTARWSESLTSTRHWSRGLVESAAITVAGSQLTHAKPRDAVVVVSVDIA